VRRHLLITVSLSAAVLLGLSASAFADTITLMNNTGSSGYSYGVGGEFAATHFQGMAIPSLGSDVSVVGGAFQTFCIEHNEYFTPGTKYDWVLNDEAVLGGLSGIDPADRSEYSGMPDPICPETAWLFTQFWNGTLASYGYDYTLGTLRKNSAHDLQEAIWYLEGEYTTSRLAAYNALSSRAQGWVVDAFAANWSDIGNVRVLNLYTQGHAGDSAYKVQDQLVMVVPLPAASLAGLALLMGLAFVGKLRRRRLALG
jgi:hypothetical protein